MMGSTLLVMPYGFATSGWLLGAGLCAFCAVVSKYTCSLVLSYGFAMPDGSAEFADLARTHFGRGGWAVAIAASAPFSPNLHPKAQEALSRHSG